MNILRDIMTSLVLDHGISVHDKRIEVQGIDGIAYDTYLNGDLFGTYFPDDNSFITREEAVDYEK